MNGSEINIDDHEANVTASADGPSPEMKERNVVTDPDETHPEYDFQGEFPTTALCGDGEKARIEMLHRMHLLG